MKTAARVATALLACTSALGYFPAAHAQDTGVSPETEETAGDQPPVEEDEGITVTGSRIVTNGDDSPSPVTVVATSDLLTTTPGVSLAEALNTIPAFSGSRQSTSNPTNTGTQSGGNGAANTLNLRNLGANRTLVLQDGRRVPPTLFNGLVDVDVIPQMLIERVDIVTGGVSAVYGSDAVSGVVNYVINRRFQGVKAEASAGISRYGDDGRRQLGIAAGTDLGDRLHVEASYEYRVEDAVTSRASRPYLRQVGVTGAGTAANPYVLGTNLRQAGFPFGALITNGALAGRFFSSNGVLTTFTPGTTTGTAAVQIGGDGGFFDGSLLSGSEAHQVFARADYELTDNVRFFVQGSGNFKTNESDGDTALLQNVTMNRANAFLPVEVRALMPTTQTTFTLSQLLSQIPPAHVDAKSRQMIYTAGLVGNLGGWNWTLDYTRGDTKLSSNLLYDVNRQKMAAALDAVSSGGQIVCNASLTNTAYADCVPFNPFGPNAASQAAIDYVTDTVTFEAFTKTDNVSASVSGDLLQGWAGPISAALSGEWRKIEFRSTSTSTPDDKANCASLRYNCLGPTATSPTPLNDFQYGASPNGLSQTVWEGAGELQVPVLKDVGIIRSFNVNGAARYTHYSTSGNYVTWKVGADLELGNTLRFRATRSRDIRAPTLYELFAPANQTIVRATDRLTNVSPTIPQRTLDNPGLKSEIGNTITAGVVWKPSSKFSLAVDGYRIAISDAITQVTGSSANLQDACYASGGSSIYCTLQVRPNGFSDTSATNAVSLWLIRNINLSSVKTWGVDVEANYSTEIGSMPVQARILAAWQPTLKYIQPGVDTVDAAGVAFGPLGRYASPSLRINANLRFKPTDNLTVDINERWRNAMKMGDEPSVWVSNYMAPFATTNLNVAWDVENDGEQSLQFFVNIQNLFDAEPPLGAFSGNGTRAGLRDGFAIGDDPRGRYFTAGAKIRF